MSLFLQRSTFLLGALILLSVTWGCKSEQGAQSRGALPGDFLLKMNKGSCFGQCQVYSLQVNPEGKLSFNGYRNVPIGEYVKQLSLPTQQSLLKAIKSSGFFELEDRYDNRDLSDLPSFTTYIRLNGKEKRVLNRFGAPEALEAFQEELISIIKPFENLELLEEQDSK